MKNIMKYILILIILVIIFIILNFYKSKNIVFEDILILGLWNNNRAKNEYEIDYQNAVEIDVFTSINNKMHEKIAPGSKGSFAIKFKRPSNTNYKIKVNEKTSKPQNLVFILENKIYYYIKDMENIINEKFAYTDEITINWEWKYYINDIKDIQDTIDGEKAQRYLFEIEAIVEETERKDV